MLFRLSDVYKSYGVQDVLRGASLQVNAGEHIGLVGRNGAGKSTIFRLVRGEESADRGDVIRARGVKLGLLDQHVHFKPGSTVHESALAAFGRLQQIEHEMHELEHRMADAGDDLDKVLERYSDLQQEFEHEGGFEYAARAEAILQGLGFDREMWSLETEKLSRNQQQLMAKTQEFIRRNIAGQKTKQAQSRRKMLEKLERLDAVRPDQTSGDFRLQAIERTGNHVLTVNELSIGYPDKLLAKDISFILRRGECRGIISPNGSGKTTFLKTILKKLEPLGGEVRWGTKVQIGYYAQQLDDLDDRNEIIMELRRVAPSTATAGELRSFLAKFLFTGDDVYKHVRDLSGGEKGRLALAMLIYSRVNVLVLDEPTNHLDIPSREALEEALSVYEGTIVTISHDRYFLDRVATQILALDGLGGAEHYDGDYTEYHDWKLGRRESSAPVVPEQDNLVSVAAAPVAEEPPPPPIKKTQAPKKTGGKGVKKKKPHGRPPELVETEIARAEQRLNEISEQMGTPEVARDAERLIALNEEYQQTEAHLRSLYDEWDRVSQEPATAN